MNIAKIFTYQVTLPKKSHFSIEFEALYLLFLPILTLSQNLIN